MKQLAIFDLDHTLIAVDCELQWACYLAQEQVITTQCLQVMRDYFDDYGNGTLNFEQYIAYSVGLWNHLSSEALSAYLSDFVANHIRPKIFPQALKQLEWHRQQGHELLMATASNRVLADAIGQSLGFTHILATELVNGSDNKVAGTGCFAEGKRLRVQAWLARQGGAYQAAYFYSDSHNDVPLLEVVRHAVCVNPDKRLRTAATQKGWYQVNWSLPQVSVLTAQIG
ncbi:HAD family hydrolase [Salinibius halmophilus]|uniref:HAD family hydrolase n=1 Tax=Salinibius halmophilus TaxID=1853216 RepID=UPI001313EE53|nr:HAD family hydrolase [Salinibius halmophilus]